MSDEAIFKAIVKAGSEFDKYDRQATKEVMALLNGARREVIDALTNTQSDYARYVNSGIKTEIERSISKLNENLKRRQNGFLESSWELGIEQVDSPFRVLGVAGGFDSFKLDETILLKLKDFSATLITNLSAETLPKIDTAIKVGLLKGESVINIARQIGTNLKDPSIFKSVAERSIVIAQTEMNRVYNTATNDRYKMVQNYVPGLKKMWSNAGDSHVRPSHQRLNGQVVDVGKKFYDSLTGISIDRPGDPEAPASFTVRCRCRSVPFKENWDINWDKHGYKPYSQSKGKEKVIISYGQK